MTPDDEPKKPADKEELRDLEPPRDPKGGRTREASFLLGDEPAEADPETERDENT